MSDFKKQLQKSQERRIISNKEDSRHLIIKPDAESLISDALEIIGTEIVKFRSKTKSGISLSLPEARVLQGYIKSLVDLAKESREADKTASLENMSDDELIKLAAKVLLKNEIVASEATPVEDSGVQNIDSEDKK